MAQEEMQEQDYSMDMIARVRTLEGRYNMLRDRVLIINNNMIEEYKKLVSEMTKMNEDLRAAKSENFKMRETMKHLIKEFDLFARKEDVKYLEKYINLWNPVKCVTEADVKKIIEEEKEVEVHASK